MIGTLIKLFTEDFWERRKEENKTVSMDSAIHRRNPYILKWYDSKMTQKQLEANNANYWEWEMKYNGFKCP